jgi:hypothetical protein
MMVLQIPDEEKGVIRRSGGDKPRRYTCGSLVWTIHR